MFIIITYPPQFSCQNTLNIVTSEDIGIDICRNKLPELGLKKPSKPCILNYTKL